MKKLYPFEKSLFVMAHPDDAEVLFAHAITAQAEAHVLVATDGEASTVDLMGDRFCRDR
jgi:LmbE family N-acetylglucosaminyl deacetylase